MSKIPVGILGATGTVGQRFVQLLLDHPWFEIAALTGSTRTIGRSYGEGVNWKLEGDPPPEIAKMIVQATEPNLAVKIVFSALPTTQAKEVEPRFAAAGYAVCTNASSYRMTDDVPLLVPEVNPDHAQLIDTQRKKRGWDGFIIANANCSTTTAILPLKIWQAAFGLEAVHMVTMQAISGAGYPGVPSLDILGNVVPYIGKEDHKLETESRKMLGKFVNGSIEYADFKVSAQANRVPVLNGHLCSMSVGFGRRVTPEEGIAAFEDWQIPAHVRALPSCPDRLLVYRHEPDRPQPRLDSYWGDGLAWTVGKVTKCGIHDLKMMALSHNTLRGAASGSVLNAELLVTQGYIAR
ncbi:MAG TPA: aspartate-semialdehyde dehydrogenase [Anaerolineae bacterium]|nr:aspartate-semialdehyde dehydrogenase [Anaerolineae bacterium]